MALFMNFLDIAALNSMVIWCQFNPNFGERHYKRTIFLKQLIHELIKPQVERRSQNLKSIHLDVVNDMRKIIPPEFFISPSSSQSDEPQIGPSIKVVIKRCSMCQEERK